MTARSLALPRWSLRPLVLILLAAALAGVAALALRSDHHDAGGFEVAFAALGMAFGWSGVMAHDRRPDNPIGTLLVVVGFGFAIGNLELSSIPLTYTIGTALDTAWIGLLIHTLAIYPSGRFDGPISVAFAAAGWMSTLVLQVVATFVTEPRPASCPECPENLLSLRPDAGLAEAVTFVQVPVLGTLTLVLGALTLARRWRVASAVARRAILPTLAVGIGAVVLIVAAVLLEDAPDTVSLAADLAAGAAVLAIPAALLVGVLRLQLTPGRLGTLARRLNSALTHDDLRATLAWTLDDPDLVVRYWAGDRFVDEDGHPVAPEPAPGRGSTVIEHEGRRVARLEYDPALDDAPHLIETVAATAALALENERLRTELRARLVALGESRARIVAAEAAERRRLERNLHDGAQQRLLGLGISLQLVRGSLEDRDPEAAEAVARAEGELRAAVEELRDLANGLHPAVLSESGLDAAVESLAERAPFPVVVDRAGDEVVDRAGDEVVDRAGGEVTAPAGPTEVAAYYVVAEALANTIKHAGATEARVELVRRPDRLVVTVTDDGAGGADPQGSGLTGLADRVGAVGGTLTVTGPSGGGTRIRAVLPCG